MSQKLFFNVSGSIDIEKRGRSELRKGEKLGNRQDSARKRNGTGSRGMKEGMEEGQKPAGKSNVER